MEQHTCFLAVLESIHCEREPHSVWGGSVAFFGLTFAFSHLGHFPRLNLLIFLITINDGYKLDFCTCYDFISIVSVLNIQ